jgi:hypothetical protein
VDAKLPATVLASYNSRSRIVRDREGSIRLFWGALSIRMTQSEFLSFVGLVIEAAGCTVRCGELAKCPCGRATRCLMGQIMVSHDDLTLWFSPEEFEEFYRLGCNSPATACGRPTSTITGRTLDTAMPKAHEPQLILCRTQ